MVSRDIGSNLHMELILNTSNTMARGDALQEALLGEFYFMSCSAQLQ